MIGGSVYRSQSLFIYPPKKDAVLSALMCTLGLVSPLGERQASPASTSACSATRCWTYDNGGGVQLAGSVGF